MAVVVAVLAVGEVGTIRATSMASVLGSMVGYPPSAAGEGFH
jgi:hypothetical protein